MKRFGLVEQLHNLGVHCGKPCDSLNETPLTHALRMDDKNLASLISMLRERDIKIANLFYKNFLRQKAVKKYRTFREKVIFLQKLYRKGFFVRRVKEIEEDAVDDMLPVSSQFAPPSTAQSIDLSKLQSEVMLKKESKQEIDDEDNAAEVSSEDDISVGENDKGESGEEGNEEENS